MDELFNNKLYPGSKSEVVIGRRPNITPVQDQALLPGKQQWCHSRGESGVCPLRRFLQGSVAGFIGLFGSFDN
jgi:hypothetical protein